MSQVLPSAPKASRLHVGLAGRVNVGKSSFLICLRDRMLPSPPRLPARLPTSSRRRWSFCRSGRSPLIDTAGVDDTSALSSARIEKTNKALRRADILAVIVTPDAWSEYEDVAGE